jgi:hypothetical protein
LIGDKANGNHRPASDCNIVFDAGLQIRQTSRRVLHPVHQKEVPEMSYGTGEDSLLAVVRGLADWSTTNSAQSDWSILNSGADKKYLILKPGETYENEKISIGNRTSVTEYQTVVEVWRLFETFGTDLRTIQDLVNDIIARIEKFPNLGNGQGNAIHGALAASGGEMEERWTSGKGPKWLYWEVIVEWKEERRYTSSEI